MRIIEKIEIEKFRSFGTGKKDKITININDLNIFSGKNNSGKSNVLKALNLFFNQQTGFNEEFDFDKDYNKAFTTSYGGVIREISIKIYFNKTGNGILKNGFYIEKKFKQNGLESEKFFYKDSNKYIEAKKGQQKKQFVTYLNKINYIYIPAIRDKDFIKYIFKNLQQVLDTNFNDKKGYETSFSNITEILDKRTKKLGEVFQGFIGIPTNVSAPTKILDILEGITLNTDPGIIVEKKVKGARQEQGVKVSAKSSGDGITMSYLPHFLDFLSENIKSKKFIRGFEEPENSLEYSKIQDLSIKFLKYFTKKNQIFITTHNPAFIKLKEQPKTSFYRVYKEDWDNKRLSKIETEEQLKKQLSLFEEENNENAIKRLNEEINFVEFSEDIQKIIDERQSFFDIEKQNIEIQKKTLQEQIKSISSLKPSKIFICEDKKGISVWKHFFDEYNISGINIYSSNGCSNFEEEISIKKIMEKEKRYNPRIFRQNDRDGYTEEQCKELKKILEKKFEKINYNFSLLPVCEIENFLVLSNDLSGIDNEIISEIEDSTRETASDNLKKIQYTINHWKEENKERYNLLFDPKSKTENMMMKEARNSKNKYFKGKLLCKKFNISEKKAISNLKKLKKDNFPEELKQYLEEIKTFFNS